MKNMRGFVDPISLTFAIVLGIAAMGNHKQGQIEQQMAEDAAPTAAVIQAEVAKPASNLLVSK